MEISVGSLSAREYAKISFLQIVSDIYDSVNSSRLH